MDRVKGKDTLGWPVEETGLVASPPDFCNLKESSFDRNEEEEEQ